MAMLASWLWDDSPYWTVFGLVGNLMFTSRFVVQWYHSERLKQSVIPRNFWHLSLVGGVVQLLYTLHLWKLPIILGAVLPPVIAARNLMLIAKHQPPRPGHGPPDAPLPDDGTAAPTAAAPGLPVDDAAPVAVAAPARETAPETVGGRSR